MSVTASMRLWGWPVALGILTAAGLTTALVSDGWGDVASWVGLGIPLLVMAGHAFGPTRKLR